MTAYDTEAGVTLAIKRKIIKDRNIRAPYAIFTWSDDIEPKLLCDAPVSMLTEGMDIIEIVYPEFGVKQ